MTDLTSVDRDAAAGNLSRRATAGGMTLGEYAERAAALSSATSHAEIDAALGGLDGAGVSEPAVHRGLIVGIFGGARQRGRWRLPRRLGVIAVFGGANLDLSSAEPEAPESTIVAVAAFGGIEIAAPPGVPVILTGFSVLGGRSDERPPGPPLPGAPVVRVRGLALLGGVTVGAPR